jgi:hypothetical protein
VHWPYTCDTSLDAHRRQLQLLSTQQSTKISKKLKKIKNSLKKWRFCHARHETVTHGNWKTDQFIIIKLRRFWHHRDLCSRVEKWSNRDDRQTHTHTDTHTHRHTHTQTHGHQIFYCFIVFRDLNNVQKSRKKWVYKNFIFRMNSVLRHSNASRSKFHQNVTKVHWKFYEKMFRIFFLAKS